MATERTTPRAAIRAFCSQLRRLGVRPQRVVLFGSYATRRQRAGSDIDLIVISRDFHGKGLRRRLELLGIAAARALVPVQALGYTPEEVERREPGGFLDDIMSSPTEVVH